MDRIYLLLGSNLGDRATNLEKAQSELRAQGITVKQHSRVYQTPPWGVTDQPDFLNQALEIECSYPPVVLLKILKQIERRLGRRPGRRWGPRLIDIDILFYDNRIVASPRLSIPHPRFSERAFAIVPMAEIAPAFKDPASGQTMADYRHRIKNEGIEIYRR